jgi:hypothetical protein
MKRSIALAMTVAGFFVAPATALAQSPGQVSANDESRTTSQLSSPTRESLDPGGGAGGIAASSGGSSDPGGSGLAFTGFEVGILVAVGLGLAGAGTLLRRSIRER